MDGQFTLLVVFSQVTGDGRLATEADSQHNAIGEYSRLEETEELGPDLQVVQLTWAAAWTGSSGNAMASQMMSGA